MLNGGECGKLKPRDWNRMVVKTSHVMVVETTCWLQTAKSVEFPSRESSNEGQTILNCTASHGSNLMPTMTHSMHQHTLYLDITNRKTY